MLELESPGARDQIEDYLDQTCAPMVSQKPYEERAAIREELRSHLVALVRASVELGASEAEAVRSALQKMGRPTQVARAFGIRRRFPWSGAALVASVILVAVCMAAGRVQATKSAPTTPARTAVAVMDAPAGSNHANLVASAPCESCHRSVVAPIAPLASVKWQKAEVPGVGLYLYRVQKAKGN